MSSEATAREIVRIFISSPGDVAEERALARRVVERLQGDFAPRAILEPVFWEHEPLRATGSWHEQILSPAEADIVICILWSRLGTRQPAEITRPDGSRYDSGTEYEFEEAWRSYREKGQPDLLVYRKTREPRVSLRDKTELMERLEQKESLDRFMDTWFQNREEGTLIAAFHPFEAPDDFEEIFEVHLRKLLEQRLPSVDSGRETRVKTWTAGSPYRGLNAFDFAHAPVFFGRTRATSEVLEALRAQAERGLPFVLVLGMSGCGKSSLVRAGVLPLLTQPGVIEGVGLWRWAVVRPSDAAGDPFAGLAAALLRQHALPELGADGTGMEELAGLLRERPEAAFPLFKGGLSQAASELARSEGLERQPEARLVLLVDQLEELFAPGISDEVRQGFIEALRGLVASRRVWVLATLRSDFYPRLTELPALVALKEGGGQYDLLAPTPAEIGQMIRQPAQLAGLGFEERQATGERLDDVLRDEATRNPEALPLLQFTLEELYGARSSAQELTFAAFEEMGGVGGALAQRAEAAFTALAPDERAALPQVLSRLVTISGEGAGGATRRRAALDGFAPASAARGLVERFVAARLCVTDRDESGRAVVSVSHEALLEHWPRLAEWLEHSRHLLQVRERLDAAARQWDAEGRPSSYLLASGKRLAEAEELEGAEGIELPAREHAFLRASLARGRRSRWLKQAAVAVLAVLALLAATGGWLANVKRQEAEISRGESEAVTGFLSNMLAAVDPDELGRDVRVTDVLEEAAGKIRDLDDQPLIQARLQTTMGRAYTGLGFYDRAKALFEESLETRQRLLGPEHRRIASSLNDLGYLHWRQGEFEPARAYLERALEMKQTTLGEDHVEVANTLNNLANVLDATGDARAAKPLYERAVAIYEGTPRPETEALANVLNNLGLLVSTLGQPRQAREHYERALSILEQEPGRERLLTATVLSNLGVLLDEMGEREPARELLERSVTMGEEALGPAHPELSHFIDGLAIFHAMGGQLDSAEPLFRRSLEIREEALGPEHPMVARSVSNLGEFYLESGDLDRAVELSRRGLALRERILGPEHLLIADNLQILARAHSSMGEPGAARRHFERAVAILENALGPRHPKLAESLDGFARVLRDLGEAEESERCFQRTLGIREETLGPDHPAVAATLEGYAALLRESGRTAQAAELEERARAIRRPD